MKNLTNKLLSLGILTSTLFIGLAEVHGQVQINQPVYGQTPWYANAGLAYGFEVEEPGLSLGGGYQIAQVEGLRIGTEFIWYFVDNDSWGTSSVDADFWTWSAFAQYSFYQDQDWDVYALGGLMYSRIKFDFRDGPSGFRGSSSDSDVGLVLGIGGEYRVMNNGSVYADFKYNTGTYDQGVLSAGFRYFF